MNNELLHGDTFENKTGDPEITQYMHQATRVVDPDVQLFINDYQIVQAGTYTAVCNPSRKIFVITEECKYSLLLIFLTKPDKCKLSQSLCACRYQITTTDFIMCAFMWTMKLWGM